MIIQVKGRDISESDRLQKRASALQRDTLAISCLQMRGLSCQAACWDFHQLEIALEVLRGVSFQAVQSSLLEPSLVWGLHQQFYQRYAISVLA